MTYTKFIYKATIQRIVDGDTIDAEVDLGFKIYHRVRFRLNSINAPEMNSTLEEERLIARRARDFLIDLILNKKVIILSKQRDKFGRFLADIYLDEQSFLNNQSVNILLVEQGLAKRI